MPAVTTALLLRDTWSSPFPLVMRGPARKRCHGARSAHVRDRQGTEAPGEADGGGGTSAAANPRRDAVAPESRGARRRAVRRPARPAAGGLARLRALVRALRLDPAAGAAQQSQPDPRPARDASAHRPRAPVPGLHRGRHAGPRTRQGRVGARPVGPAAAPRTHPQRQADHRRQDPAEHPRLAPPAPLLAQRPLHRAAASPRGGHRLADEPPLGPRPRGHPRGGARLQREAGGGPAEPRRARDHVRGTHRRSRADHPGPVRLPRCPLGERHARLRPSGPRSLPPQLGDWSDTIRSGRIQPAKAAGSTVELPPRLAELARAWGYPTV